MHSVTPVTFVTPDGVERKLRATQGARRLIFDKYKMHVQAVLNEYGDAAFGDILFALMHDEEGNPPKDLTAKKLAFMLPMDSGAEIMASIMAAFSQGKADPNELKALLEKAMNPDSSEMTTETADSSTPGPSPDSASDSQT